MNLDDWRSKIDEIDDKLVRLIAERIRVASEIGKKKNEQNKHTIDREREKVVLDNVSRIAREENINANDINIIYQEIIAASKRIQGIEVAYHGESGAFNEEAIFQFFGHSVSARSFEKMEDVFKLVEEGRIPFGMIPVENSREGSVGNSYDLLLETAVTVYGEIEQRITHCLIASPGASLDSIKKIYAHPQALEQCRDFLKHLRSELIPTYNTARSVKMIKDKKVADGAVIASERAAGIYGMAIIASGIEDNPANFTRFFIISKRGVPPSGNDKTSLAFGLKNEPGVFYKALSKFAARNINLTKIESRPTRQRPWEYNFFIDLEGHYTDPTIKQAIDNLEKASVFFKIMGSYPKAK
jgi:chorismate mutase/prephenate dehydratase